MSDIASRLTAALADRYRLDRDLGGGGMSRVWVATETALDRQVLEELGDHEAAVSLLAEAIARRDSWLVTFSRSPRYDQLRKDPRAAAMLARLETKSP